MRLSFLKTLMCLSALASVRTAICLSLVPVAGFAQGFPTKPVRVVVGQAPGGAPDTLARILAERFQDVGGQTAIVENRTGAGGLVGTEVVSRSPADGYTTGFVSAADVLAQATLRESTFDIERDLAPVGMVASSSLVLYVDASSPIRSVQDLVAMAKAKPGMVNYGSGGAGSPPHLLTELLSIQTDTKMVHVPYKGGVLSVQALIAGDIQAVFASPTTGRPFVDSGRVRAIAVASSSRISAMPSVPTLNEAGIPGDFNFLNWYAIMVPQATPNPIAARLNEIFEKIVGTPEVTARMATQGFGPRISTPQQLKEETRKSLLQSKRLVQAIGLKSE